MTKKEISEYMAKLGAKGGKVKSKAKKAASKANAIERWKKKRKKR